MQYKSGRPKGFAEWKPQQATQQIMNQVQEVLAQYREHWPLTIRQIFYRLVGVYGYEKTEKGYTHLGEYMGIVEDERPTVVLHIGDLDPSGVCIFDSIEADVMAFVGRDQEVLFKRIALTPEQVVLYGLPTSPPKATDKRGEGIKETCQCEALPPDTLAQIVKAAVQEYIDDGQYALDRYMEEQERAHLIEKLQMLAA